MVFQAILFALAAAASPAQTFTIKADDTGLSCVDAGQHSRRLVTARVDGATVSPDGHTVAWLRVEGKPAGPDYAAVTSVWTGDCRTLKARRLLASRPASEPKANLTGFNTVTFSLDGGFVYVLTEAWATSNAVHQISLKTGKTRFVTDANSLSIIRTGPWRGYLLVQQHKYHDDDRGAYDPTYVVRPDGHVQMMVPKTDLGAEIDFTAQWLEENGWSTW